MRALVLMVLGLLANAWAEQLPGPRVWPIQIKISAEDAARLRTTPREYVRAIIRVRETEVAEAAVRLKGHGSFQPLDQKPSFTIQFDKYAAGQRPYGLEKIHLNNSVEDSSYLKEQIGSEIFESAGIPSPRVGHATVSLNGKSLGMYVLREGFSESFLQRHFPGTIGTLYDTEAGHDVDQDIEPDLVGTGGDAHIQLKALASAAKELDLMRRWAGLEAILDVDMVLRFMAAEMMICHWDGYCLSQNNFRLYYAPERAKFLFLPSGMDQIFSQADLSWKPAMAGLVARSLLETSAGRARYEETFRRLVATAFRVESLTNRIAQIVSELRPALDAPKFEAVRAEGELLGEKISQRHASVVRQLQETGSRVPVFINGFAALAAWQPFDEPAGGRLIEQPSALRIIAGPKTSASWRMTVRLKPGRYVFSGIVRTLDVMALPFGTRQGATLRVIGKDAHSAGLLNSNAGQTLTCAFQLSSEEEITLSCELRASSGEAIFEKSLKLEVEPGK